MTEIRKQAQIRELQQCLVQCLLHWLSKIPCPTKGILQAVIHDNQGLCNYITINTFKIHILLIFIQRESKNQELLELEYTLEIILAKLLILQISQSMMLFYKYPLIIYHVSCISLTLFYFILTTNLRDKYYYSYIRVEKTEVQRGQLTCQGHRACNRGRKFQTPVSLIPQPYYSNYPMLPYHSGPDIFS